MLSSEVIAKVSADPSLNGQCFGSGLFLSGGVAIVRSVCNFFRRDKFPLWLAPDVSLLLPGRDSWRNSNFLVTIVSVVL